MPAYDDKWNWQWIPGTDGIGIEEVGYRFIYSAYLQDNNVESHPYNMIGHSEGGNTIQHHFWFRCEREIMALLSTGQRGVHFGRLAFRQKNSKQPCLVNIYIDLHRRYQSETELAMKGIQPKPHRPLLSGPVCRSISLHEIEFNDLHDGCKTVGGEDVAVHGQEVANGTND
jgi:hypothetical protein